MRACGHIDSVSYISWVTNGDLYLTSWEVFKMAKECLLEGVVKEEAEVGIFNDMCMYFKRAHCQPA